MFVSSGAKRDLAHIHRYRHLIFPGCPPLLLRTGQRFLQSIFWRGFIWRSLLWTGTVRTYRSEQTVFLLKPLIRESEDTFIRRGFWKRYIKTMLTARHAQFYASLLSAARIWRNNIIYCTSMDGAFERSSSIEDTNTAVSVPHWMAEWVFGLSQWPAVVITKPYTLMFECLISVKTPLHCGT
jgi:hypothetical protein